jgi:hypothetical protein
MGGIDMLFKIGVFFVIIFFLVWAYVIFSSGTGNHHNRDWR